jgi:hypothetical protein
MHVDSKGHRTRVIRDVAERDHIVEQMHAGVIGGAHFGQDASIRKVYIAFNKT